jgi:hypothetical protein
VSYKSSKARFQVTWMGDAGTDKAGQVGVQSVDPVRCIWDAATLPTNSCRYVCHKSEGAQAAAACAVQLGAELYMQDSEALVRVDVRNINLGGCFVEMPTLPPDKARLKIIVWAADNKLAMEGVVAGRRPGFGITIKFTEMTEEVRQELQRFIQSLVFRSQ